VKWRKQKEVRGKRKLRVEWAFDPTPLRCEGKWSYFIFTLSLSYFVEGRFDS
jgi:hypothetical protein